jgi:hypothetical protein
MDWLLDTLSWPLLVYIGSWACSVLLAMVLLPKRPSNKLHYAVRLWRIGVIFPAGNS